MIATLMPHACHSCCMHLKLLTIKLVEEETLESQPENICHYAFCVCHKHLYSLKPKIIYFKHSTYINTKIKRKNTKQEKAKMVYQNYINSLSRLSFVEGLAERL